MATAYVTIRHVVTRDVFNGASARTEIVATAGTAVSGALVAARGDIAGIYCAAPLYARSGATAAAANSVYCPADVTTYISMTEGSVISLVDA